MLTPESGFWTSPSTASSGQSSCQNDKSFFMTNAPQEVELKLPLSDKKKIVGKLEKLGATFVSEVTQTDYFFDSPYFNFAEKDEGFRLRHETSSTGEKAFLTYKGRATFSKEGHKIRTEYEISVSDFETAKQILLSVRFQLTTSVKKVRTTYHVHDIVVAIDELKFGTFIELEGDEKKSQALRNKLGLGEVEAIKKPYFALQIEYSNN